MLKSICSCFTVKPPYKYDVLTYQAAGCLFTNNQLVLAGYQPNKSLPYISGIGGTKMPGETFQRTAFRETLEEIFNVNTFPLGLLNTIELILEPTRIMQNGNYIIIVLTFEDLGIILRICRAYNLKTPIYDTIPLRLNDLIFNRKFDISAEITHLALIPLAKKVTIDPYFVEDLDLM
jgi:hypothetical protein